VPANLLVVQAAAVPTAPANADADRNSTTAHRYPLRAHRTDSKPYSYGNSDTYLHPHAHQNTPAHIDAPPAAHADTPAAAPRRG
jgi:hypothetical protein